MNNIARYIIITVVVIIVGYILWYFKSIVAYILISLILSLVGRPVVELLGRIEIKRIKIPIGIRALITLIFIWVLVITFFRVFIPLISNEANQLSNTNPEEVINNLRSPIDKLNGLIYKYSLNKDNGLSLEDQIQEYLVSLLSFSMISNLFGSIAGILGDIFIAAFAISFITFFFLKDQTMFSNALLLLVPEKHEEAVKRALTSIRKLLMRYFLGIILEVTGIIILVTLGLTIVGVGFTHGLVIGLVAGLLNIIPYLGPIMGSLIGILLGVSSHLHLPFYNELLPMIGYMCLVFIAVQVIDNIFFQPFIYSSSVNAHPLEIFLVILIAGSLAGITGMVLAIPSYTVIRVFAREFFNNLKLVKKLTEKIT